MKKIESIVFGAYRISLEVYLRKYSDFSTSGNDYLQTIRLLKKRKQWVRLRGLRKNHQFNRIF